MVERARRRLAGFGDRVRLSQGDATSIPAEDASYDAVFDFGIIHHVPDWRRALREVSRVLRPGGRFFFEEVTQHALARWSYRRFLDPPTEDRFSGAAFIAEVERSGLRVPRSTERFFGDFVFGVGFRGKRMNERLRSAFREELAAARRAESERDRARAWRHLERAHVLSQPHAWRHLCVHGRMFSFALRKRDLRELLGQLPRLLLAAPGSLTGRAPRGNTGGADVGIFIPMEIPADLEALLRE